MPEIKLVKDLPYQSFQLSYYSCKEDPKCKSVNIKFGQELLFFFFKEISINFFIPSVPRNEDEIKIKYFFPKVPIYL